MYLTASESYLLPCTCQTQPVMEPKRVGIGRPALLCLVSSSLQNMSSFLIKCLERTFFKIFPSCSNRISMSSRSRNGTACGAGISPAGRRDRNLAVRCRQTVLRLASEKTPTPGYFTCAIVANMTRIWEKPSVPSASTSSLRG
jgi:hypothetical protein